MGKQWKVIGFILGAPKSLQMVTAAMKLKNMLLGRKAMTNLDNILESRDITLPTKVCMYVTIKKDEHQRIDAFELWCWRRLLIVS